MRRNGVLRGNNIEIAQYKGLFKPESNSIKLKAPIKPMKHCNCYNCYIELGLRTELIKRITIPPVVGKNFHETKPHSLRHSRHAA